MQTLTDETSSSCSAVNQLHSRHVTGNDLLSKWKQASLDIKCPYINRLPQRAKTLVDKYVLLITFDYIKFKHYFNYTIC